MFTILRTASQQTISFSKGVSAGGLTLYLRVTDFKSHEDKDDLHKADKSPKPKPSCLYGLNSHCTSPSMTNTKQ